MKKLLLLILIGCSASFSIQAQTYDQQKVQLQFLNHYGKIYQRGAVPDQTLGSPYFNDDWMPVDIKFRDTLLRFDQVKLNMLNSDLEVLFNGEEKRLSNAFFEYVLVPEGGEKKTFVPAVVFKYDGKPLDGFMDVQGAGKIKVLVHHYAFIREPHAQAHITGGFTQHRLMKESNLYLHDGSKLVLIKRKKDLQDYFRSKKNALDRYFKDVNPDIKNPKHLLNLVQAMTA